MNWSQAEQCEIRIVIIARNIILINVIFPFSFFHSTLPLHTLNRLTVALLSQLQFTFTQINHPNGASHETNSIPHTLFCAPELKGTKFASLADYCAMGNSEVSMKEGDLVELKKVGCAGWWFVRVLGKCSLHDFP